MTKIVSRTGRRSRIRNLSKASPNISRDTIAESFGAVPVGSTRDRNDPSWALAYVAREIDQRLRSTGGRPALADTERKVKVPVTKDDLARLEAIASTYSKVAPSQIASILLHMAIDEFPEKVVDEAIKKHGAS